MKIKLVLLSIMFLALFSCVTTEFIERGKYELEVGKQQMIPYQKGQKINFIHSKGYAFGFKVVSDTLVWTDNNSHNYTNVKYSYYDTFQQKTVQLVSEYPALGIAFRVSAEPRSSNRLSIYVNDLVGSVLIDENYKFKAQTDYGDIFHETILINGKTYNNVIETQLRSGKSGESYKSVLFNEQGLLQIKISDDEIFSINN